MDGKKGWYRVRERHDPLHREGIHYINDDDDDDESGVFLTMISLGFCIFVPQCLC